MICHCVRSGVCRDILLIFLEESRLQTTTRHSYCFAETECMAHFKYLELAASSSDDLKTWGDPGERRKPVKLGDDFSRFQTELSVCYFISRFDSLIGCWDSDSMSFAARDSSTRGRLLQATRWIRSFGCQSHVPWRHEHQEFANHKSVDITRKYCSNVEAGHWLNAG